MYSTGRCGSSFSRRLESAVDVVFGEAEQPTSMDINPTVTQLNATCLKFMSESVQNQRIIAKSRESDSAAARNVAFFQNCCKHNLLRGKCGRATQPDLPQIEFSLTAFNSCAMPIHYRLPNEIPANCAENMTMKIQLNGAPRAINDFWTIADLLTELKLDNRYCAVERNCQVVPREQHAAAALQPGDRIEVVTLVGGG